MLGHYSRFLLSFEAELRERTACTFCPRLPSSHPWQSGFPLHPSTQTTIVKGADANGIFPVCSIQPSAPLPNRSFLEHSSLVSRRPPSLGFDSQWSFPQFLLVLSLVSSLFTMGCPGAHPWVLSFHTSKLPFICTKDSNFLCVVHTSFWYYRFRYPPAYSTFLLGYLKSILNSVVPYNSCSFSLKQSYQKLPPPQYKATLSFDLISQELWKSHFIISLL